MLHIIQLKNNDDFRTIEKENYMMENTKIKGADKLFSQTTKKMMKIL